MDQIWNAKKYSSDFSFVYEYGNDVIGLIEAQNVHSVLDLGCGNGALTHALADQGFAVTGLDASSEMLEQARRSYPDISFIQADAADFALDTPVSAVFSNAVLHWINREKQPNMMRCVFRSLQEGGQFVFEMGGSGNNALIHAALAEVFAERGYPYKMPFYFPTIGEYATLLEAAGFTVRYALLFDRPTPLRGEDGLAGWIKMFLGSPFSIVKENEREGIISEAVRRLKDKLFRDGVWYADYVRLRMKAAKERSPQKR